MQQVEGKSNFSEDEINQFHSTVKLINNNIILLESFPIRSKEKAAIQLQKVDELTENLTYFYLIADSRKITDRGDPKYRSWMNEQLNRRRKIKHLYIIVHKNSLVRIASKFILSRLIDLKFSLHDKLETALMHIQKLEEET
ncbi:MAG: hypothetical protein OEY49_16310 [Candidatus Heimdallarchaeota archaeon]|nr:hypothetical protein [Candidatus Heimdallarchaeota archaeon]